MKAEWIRLRFKKKITFTSHLLNFFHFHSCSQFRWEVKGFEKSSINSQRWNNWNIFYRLYQSVSILPSIDHLQSNPPEAEILQLKLHLSQAQSIKVHWGHVSYPTKCERPKCIDAHPIFYEKLKHGSFSVRNAQKFNIYTNNRKNF